jgi:hypothetical protein
MGIDHRVVSVAFSKPQAAKPPAEPPAAATGAVAPVAPVPPAPPAAPPAAREAKPETPAGARPEPVPANRVASAAGTEQAATSEPVLADDGRIRFAAVNLYVSGPRVQAQVELRWKGIGRMGSASGWSSRDGSHRLIAMATLAAVQEFLEETWALSLQDIEFVRLGRNEVVLVGLALITHRHEKLLAGCCPVEHDAQQAVVLATLGAVNRVVGGLPTREPTEFVLRPASRQEESGAKKF